MATTSPTMPARSDLLPAPLRPLLRSFMPDVYRLLPPDITQDQFRAACWLELMAHPEFGDRDFVVESVRDALVYAATYGLMPGRDCHLLAFRQKRYGNKKGAQCVSNYFGVLRQLDRSGKVRRAFAHPVHEGDEWSFDYFNDRPVHQPAAALRHASGKELFYYGAVQFLDGRYAFEVMSLDDLEAIRRRAPGHDSGAWATDPVMMKRKSAIKRVAKYVQLTPQQQRFLEDDDEREQEDIPLERHRQNLIDVFGEAADPGPALASASPTGSAGTSPSPDLFAQEEADAAQQQTEGDGNS